MKGIIFTEFLDMVEHKFGDQVADTIIQDSKLAADGAYTAVGTYPHSEMLSLLTNLSKQTGITIPDLLKVYGEHVFAIFSTNYSNMFIGINNAFDFLEKVENHIHVEVLKLYPDAELPRLQVSRPDDKTLIMIYHSKRKMADLAEGLINGCLKHFKEEAEVHTENITEDREHVKFTLIKK